MDIAVIKTGGKQYKVKISDIIKVEKLQEKKLEFVDILEGKKVTATKLEDEKQDKISVLKFRPKKRYKRNAGHRQTLSKIKIETIK